MFSFRRKQKDSQKLSPYFFSTQGFEKRFFVENVQRYFGEDVDCQRAVDSNTGDEGFIVQTDLDDDSKRQLVNRMRSDSRKEYESWLRKRKANAHCQVSLADQTRDSWLARGDPSCLSPADAHPNESFRKRPSSMPPIPANSSEYSPGYPTSYPMEEKSLWGFSNSAFYDEPMGTEDPSFYTEEIPDLIICRAPTLISPPPLRQPLRPTRSAEELAVAMEVYRDHWNVSKD
ncbi:hypothetical protein EDC01DRAFT_659855 [Geopyxis carbonaria]|nr:hypothetical protein EDC01DRAFT_659855 [Geopyxis carbonaria]